MLSMTLLVYISFGLIYGKVTASSIEEGTAKFSEILMQCIEEHPVSPSDIEAMQNMKIPDKESVKCLFACAYKKTGMMDDKGMLSVEGVREVSKQYLSDRPDMMKKSEEFTEACKSVNDVPVTDGDKGCERAALLFQCSLEKAPNFKLV